MREELGALGGRASASGRHTFGVKGLSRKEHRQFSIQSNPNPDTEDLLP